MMMPLVSASTSATKWTVVEVSGSLCDNNEDVQSWTIQLDDDDDAQRRQVQTREFLVYVPPSICNDQDRDDSNDNASTARKRKYPILLAFHGYGGYPMHEVKKWKPTCQGRKFILVAPRGSTNTTVDKNLGWNAIDCCGYAASHNVDDIDFVTNGIIEILGRASSTTMKVAQVADTSNVVATGFSNGGFMVSLLALLTEEERPPWLKAIVPTGGYQYDTSLYDPNDVRPLPMFAHHGGADTVVRPEGCCVVDVDPDPTTTKGHRHQSNCPANIGSLRDTCLSVQEAFSLWTNINECQHTTIETTNATSGITTCWIGRQCRAATTFCLWDDEQHVWGSHMPGVDMVGNFLEELHLESSRMKDITPAPTAVGIDPSWARQNALLYPLVAIAIVLVLLLMIAAWIRKQQPRNRQSSNKSNYRVVVDQEELTELVVGSTTRSLRIRSSTTAGAV